MTQEMENVPEERQNLRFRLASKAAGPIQNIFIKVRKDGLAKLLVGILVGVLLLLLLLIVFGPRIGIGNGILDDNESTSASSSVRGLGSVPTAGSAVNVPTPKRVIIGDTRLNVKLAVTNEEQVKGLRFSTGLAPNEGMLYLFDTPGHYPFWTKDMRYPIDMIFISSGRMVIGTAEGIAPCTGSSCQTVTPQNPVAYALEVNAGYIDEHFITKGDRVAFEY